MINHQNSSRAQRTWTLAARTVQQKLPDRAIDTSRSRLTIVDNDRFAVRQTQSTSVHSNTVPVTYTQRIFIRIGLLSSSYPTRSNRTVQGDWIRSSDTSNDMLAETCHGTINEAQRIERAEDCNRTPSICTLHRYRSSTKLDQSL